MRRKSFRPGNETFEKFSDIYTGPQEFLCARERSVIHREIIMSRAADFWFRR